MNTRPGCLQHYTLTTTLAGGSYRPIRFVNQLVNIIHILSSSPIVNITNFDMWNLILGILMIVNIC